MASKIYITHDSNARNSKKMLRMREKLGPVKGPAAYGIYWMLIERLREEEGFVSEKDYDMLAFDLRCDRDLLRAVVEDYELFDIAEDDTTFGSHGLEERMALMTARSSAGKKGAATVHSNNDSGKTSGKSAILPTSLPEANSDFATGKTSGKHYINKIKENKEIEENTFSSSSLVPSSPCVESVTEKEKEQERFVYYFTFDKNYVSPNYEYQRMVAYNSTPAVKKKWDKMTNSEKQAILFLWHPEKDDKKGRHDAAFLRVWQLVYQMLQNRGAPYDVRMAALSDNLTWKADHGRFYLYCPEVLYKWIEVPIEPSTESNLRFIKPVLLPLMQQYGCKDLMYQVVKP